MLPPKKRLLGQDRDWLRSKNYAYRIEIAYLADYPEAIPTLAQWFRAQWPEYYAGRTPAEIAQDFYLEAKRDGLPRQRWPLRISLLVLYIGC